MARLSDDELRALTDAEMQDATGYIGMSSRLAAQRQRTEYYFLALPKGDLAPSEIEGRSSVVDTSVRDVVLGMEAPLIKTFCGTEDVVEFTATKPEAEAQAKQVTEYLNHVLKKKNPGYAIVSAWIRDALLQKVGFLKVWWDDSEVRSKEEYRGQTPEQLAILLDDPEIEPIAQKTYPDPEAQKQHENALRQMDGQLAQMAQAAMSDPNAAAMLQQAQVQREAFAAQQVPMLYDVTVKRVKAGGRACIENIPPEEMLVSKLCKRMDDHTFKAHRVRRTLADLKAMGYRNVEDIASDDSPDLTPEAVERRQLDDDTGFNNTVPAVDPMQRKVWVTECYVWADVDGAGMPCWNKIVRAGHQILERTEVDDHPFVALHSIPLPHRFFGLCPADLAIEAQRTKTSVKRAILDNLYLQTNGRYFAVEGQVNLDDLLNSRPGGVVRIRTQNAVGRLDQAGGDLGGAMAMLEYIEKNAEESTGWTRISQGGDMQLDQTATQANIVSNRADSRVEIIARTMAETGMTDLFKKLLRLVTQYQNKADVVKLSGGWVTVDPREWTNQFDLTINVGLGTGNKDQQVQHLMALKQAQVAALQIGYATPQNLFAADTKLAEALGFKNSEQFFTDPQKMPQRPPQQDPAVMKAQLEDQAHQREMQFKAQQAQQDAQLEQWKKQVEAEAQMQIDRNRQQAEAQQHALKIQYEAELEHLKESNRLHLEQQRMALDQYRIDKEMDTRIVVAQIAAKQKNDAALQSAEQQANEDVARDGDD